MTKFKFFDKNSKKFVSPFKGPSNIWDKRYELGIWDNTIPDENLKKMLDLNKKNKENFDIYIKHKNKFVPATKELFPNVVKSKKKSSKQKEKKPSKKKERKASEKKERKPSKKKERKPVKSSRKNNNKNNNKDMCGSFKNKPHKGYEKNCVYERCKTCLKLKKGNVWDDQAYKSKDFSNLDSGPCKNKNDIVEYVDYNPQFQEMGLGGTDELKNGFPAGSKQLKKYGLKNC